MTTWLTVNTTGPSICMGPENSWTTSRYRAAMRILQTDYGLAGVQAAVLAVAHWRLETGCGRYEHRFNVSGLHCGNADLCTHVGNEALRAYRSLDAGIRDYFATVRSTYPAAWALLESPSPDYFPTLARAGWVAEGPRRDSAISDWSSILITTAGELGVNLWWDATTEDRFAWADAARRGTTAMQAETTRIRTRTRRSRSLLPFLILGVGALALWEK